MTSYYSTPFDRLEPRTPFKGGRIADTDLLDLIEAAEFASVHSGEKITPKDFLRAAGRGEITLRAIVHKTASLQRIGGGIYCNAGQPDENTAPSGSILNLPLSACRQLAAIGRASWREFDGFESIEGVLMRYTIAELLPDEPDFETTPDDCRVTGDAVRALADAYIAEPAPAQDTATPAPVAGAAPVAVPKQRAQESRILELLKDQGYDPLKLSQRRPGKPGPKAELRTLALNEPALFTNSSFDKAWERLRSEGAVAGAD